MDIGRLAGAVQSVIINGTDPSTYAPEGWLWIGLLWFRTTDGVWLKWNGTAWEDAGIAYDNINLTGNIYINGKKGKTANIDLGDATLKFKKGILVEVNGQEEE